MADALDAQKKRKEQDETDAAWKMEQDELFQRYSGGPGQGGDTGVQQMQAGMQQQPQQQIGTGQVETRPIGPAGGIRVAGAQPAAAQPEQAQPRRLQLNSIPDIMDFATESAKINLKYGKSTPNDLMKLAQIKKTFEDEGMQDAVGLLQAGDYQGAVQAYNSAGRGQGTLKGEPQQGVFNFNGKEIPTVTATVVDSNDNETTINTAQWMAAKIGLDKQFDLMLKKEMADEKKRHNQAMEGVYSTRVARMGGAGAGGGGTSTRGTGTYGAQYKYLTEIEGLTHDEAVEEIKSQQQRKTGEKPLTLAQRAQMEKRLSNIMEEGSGSPLPEAAEEANFLAESLGKDARWGEEKVPAVPGKKILGFETGFGARPESTKVVKHPVSAGIWGRENDGSTVPSPAPSHTRGQALLGLRREPAQGRHQPKEGKVYNVTRRDGTKWRAKRMNGQWVPIQ